MNSIVVVILFVTVITLTYGHRHGHHGGGSSSSSPIFQYLHKTLNLSTTDIQLLINETLAMDLSTVMQQITADISQLPTDEQLSAQQLLNEYGPPASLISATNNMTADQKLSYSQLKSNGSYMALQAAIDTLVASLPSNQSQAQHFLESVFFASSNAGRGHGGGNNRHGGGGFDFGGGQRGGGGGSRFGGGSNNGFGQGTFGGGGAFGNGEFDAPAIGGGSRGGFAQFQRADRHLV